MFSVAVVPQYFRKLSHQILDLIFRAKDQHWAYEQIQIAFHYVISSLLFSGISFISLHFFNTCLPVILSFVLQSACKLLRDRNPSLLWNWAASHSKGSRSRSGSTSFTVQSHQTFQRSPLQIFSSTSGLIGTGLVEITQMGLICFALWGGLYLWDGQQSFACSHILTVDTAGIWFIWASGGIWFWILWIASWLLLALSP